LVWSDPEIARLSREFVTVADEVYMLYPEDQWNLDRVKNNPDHLLFKKFGEQVPKNEWHHPGTKQGTYMMGPNGEYLEAKFASSTAPDILARMRRALDRWETLRKRWETLRKEKGYANEPVPTAKASLPPEVAGKALVFQVSLRDLPRGPSSTSGARFEQVPNGDRAWMDFVKWAWNQNWIGFDEPSAWATDSAEPVPVVPFTRLAREVLVDNVRGQGGPWKPADVKVADLSMRRIAVKDGLWSVEYRGRAEMDAGVPTYRCTLYGQALWDPRTRAFREFELVATGMRSGAWRFNQRENDPGPAPLGIVVTLPRP